MDVPVFLYDDERQNDKEFKAVTKNDIIATIKFLYKRGMWSRYHYTMWMKEVENMDSEEMLHLWWDSIVGGAMFETEPMLEAKMKAMEEFEEDSLEKKKMCKRQKHNLRKRK